MGKGTIIKKSIDNYPNIMKCSVSHTTRNLRIGEIDGVNYYHVNKNTMYNMINNNLFIEYDTLYGNIYGTSYKTLNDICKSGNIPVIEVSINGLKHIKEKEIPCNCIYIAPPSISDLNNRLIRRKTESNDIINLRMKNVNNDIKYGVNHSDYIIINDDLNSSTNCFNNILRYLYPDIFFAREKIASY